MKHCHQKPIMRQHSLRLKVRRHEHGMTMIELLVAFVIFSFGMLGLAGLQTRTLSLSQSGLYRSQAMALAADALDQMRSSIILARAGKWNTGLTDAASSVSVSGGGIADTELKKWKERVEAELPSGQASIQVATSATGTSNTVTIEIRWDDDRGRSGTKTAFTTVSRL